MGGGKGGRRKSGKSNPNRDGESSGRKPIISGGRFPVVKQSSSIHQESTSKVGSSTKNESRLRGTAFGFIYSGATAEVDGRENFSDPFVDQDPSPYQAVDVPSYEYHPSIVGGFGLGYRSDRTDGEEEEAVAVQLDGGEMDGLESYSTPVISKSKFLTIGGVRIYTEDSSSPDVGEDGLDSDGESSDSGAGRISVTDESNSSDSEDGEEEDDSDGSSDVDSCSDIDEELAEDYLEGIGGSSELLKAEWLKTVKLSKSDTNDLIRSDGSRAKRGGGDKLGGIALMNASKEYGMMKPRSGKGKGKMKPHQFGSPIVDIDLSGLDDFLFVKDSRAGSGKKKLKQQPPLSRSWPGEAWKNRKYDSFPGGKVKHRKELIAMKRKQRMVNRGVDLDQINKKLRELVINDADMFAFQPMHSRDCFQVQKLASIYQLRSGFQGSGKKRFVTVTRTERTALPSLKDKDHLDKILGAGDEDFVVSSDRLAQGRSKGSRSLRFEARHSAPSKSAKSKNGGDEKKQKPKLSYAEKPVSFVSRGIMQADSPIEFAETKEMIEVAEASSSKLGAFEMHTKGFGSRMLSKMGFVEGGGLGKSGQGMVRPIEAIKRPRSLGLGIEFAEPPAEEARAEGVRGIGAFEKHTKGFGSRMMVRMGFVPGSGLGKDAQGAIDPLAAVRRPKGRGLGAT